jgi:hypothetical protein
MVRICKKLPRKQLSHLRGKVRQGVSQGEWQNTHAHHSLSQEVTLFVTPHIHKKMPQLYLK